MRFRTVIRLVALAAVSTYCTGQPVADSSGPLYPNGQRVVDGFGKEYYPNGTRLVNDYGDEIRYSNGAHVRSATGELLFPNGTSVKSATGSAPVGAAVVTVAADLAAGRLDRSSIGAVCPSGR